MSVQVGGVVSIRDAFGTGDLMQVKVLKLGMKYDRPLFDYWNPTSDSLRWAYESQIVSQETVEADGFRYHT